MNLDYFNKVVSLTKDEVFEEIFSICDEVGFERKWFSILSTSGLNYSLKELSFKLYIKGLKIDPIIREKIIILHILEKQKMNYYNIFELNYNLKKEVNSWYKDKIEKIIEGAKIELIKIVKETINYET